MQSDRQSRIVILIASDYSHHMPCQVSLNFFHNFPLCWILSYPVYYLLCWCAVKKLLTHPSGCCVRGMLPGGEKQRAFWRHYYRDADAAVFVMDSACSDDELALTRAALHDALADPNLIDLPCLLLANCQDKTGARTEQQVTYDITSCELCFMGWPNLQNFIRWTYKNVTKKSDVRKVYEKLRKNVR